MNTSPFKILTCFLACCQIAFASAQPLNKTTTLDKDGLSTQPAAPGIFNELTGDLLYGYTNFNFSSSSGLNYNRYQGSSSIYAGGADHIKIRPDITTGLYVFHILTDINSQTAFFANPATRTSQDITNNTIFAHAMKTVTPQFFVDLAGGYGQNRVGAQSRVFPSPLPGDEGVGYANYFNNNWFTSLNGIYSTTWKNLAMKASLGALYSQVDTGRYVFNLKSTGAVPNFTTLYDQTISPLTSKATLLIESAEIGYNQSSQVMPFVNAALIQVVLFSNSRFLVDAASIINGSIPQLNMNQNGYRVGGGIGFSNKRFKLRIEEKYYNASGIFTSTQTLVSLECSFN